MWHNVILNVLPALFGSGLVGLILGLTRKRSVPWILIMMLTLVLMAAGTQIVWELWPELRHGWKHVAAIIGVAVVVCIPFSLLMRRFCKKSP